MIYEIKKPTILKEHLSRVKRSNTEIRECETNLDYNVSHGFNQFYWKKSLEDEL